MKSLSEFFFKLYKGSSSPSDYNTFALKGSLEIYFLNLIRRDIFINLTISPQLIQMESCNQCHFEDKIECLHHIFNFKEMNVMPIPEHFGQIWVKNMKCLTFYCLSNKYSLEYLRLAQIVKIFIKYHIDV